MSYQNTFDRTGGHEDAPALTCWSCTHCRPERCERGIYGWPARRLSACPAGCYEPGSDEAERREGGDD